MSGFVPVDVVAAVQAHLRARVTDLADIEGETDFARLVTERRLPARFPAAFVVATGLSAQFQRRVGTISHTVIQGVSIVLVQQHAGNASGDRARAAVWPLELAVITALAGWRPANGYAGFALTESRLQGLGAAGATGAVASTISFATEWHLHSKETAS